MIRKEEIFIKMMKEVRVKYRFENFRYRRSKGNRSVVGGIRAFTLLRNRMYKCVLPRRIDREPGGVRVAKNRTNFLIYDVVVYMSEVTNMAVCRSSAGGCDQGRSFSKFSHRKCTGLGFCSFFNIGIER